MTEITPDQNTLKKIASLSKQKQGKEADSGQALNFSRILAERLNENQEDTKGKVETHGGLPELEASFAARLSQTAGTDVSDLVQNITASLDQLDTYAQWLADPDKTLRQADTLLGEITTSIQNLVLDAESESDTQIQGILNHLSTLVAVEKIKMDRGDYT